VEQQKYFMTRILLGRKPQHIDRDVAHTNFSKFIPEVHYWVYIVAMLCGILLLALLVLILYKVYCYIMMTNGYFRKPTDWMLNSNS
jgi:uncharacterized protein (DUF2062 family)